MPLPTDIRYIGVYDKKIDLFEGQYPVPDGICYNSYLVLDEKTAVFDTVDAAYTDEWLKNLRTALMGRTPDYLIVQHMEPDHSASIARVMAEYPSLTLVSSEKAFSMMRGFFGTDFAGRSLTVSEGDTLSLGKHSLRFIAAPMVHWPEVFVTYDEYTKTLFSADAFGRFGNPDSASPWKDEARRYYIGIVGKYGAQVLSLLKKASPLDIRYICSLHGPILSGDAIKEAVRLYTLWASYTPEENGVAVAYTSVYGNTKKAVLELCEMLSARGVRVALHDLARDDVFEAVADAFRFPTLVLATTTYNADIFPAMRAFTDHLKERGFKNRKVAIIENGSWAPMAAKILRERLSTAKDISFAKNTVRILSALSDESRTALNALADELSADLQKADN